MTCCFILVESLFTQNEIGHCKQSNSKAIYFIRVAFYLCEPEEEDRPAVKAVVGNEDDDKNKNSAWNLRNATTYYSS